MLKVYKYMLPIIDYPVIDLPEGAEILHVAPGPDANKLFFWAKVNQNAPLKTRKFRIAGTGHPIHEIEAKNFITTVIAPPFVWHLFDLNENPLEM